MFKFNFYTIKTTLNTFIKVNIGIKTKHWLFYNSPNSDRHNIWNIRRSI